MAKQQANYKRKLIECRELRSQGGRSAYRRAKMLCEVFDDQDFRGDAGALDDFAAAEALDEYLEDVCLSFMEARFILQQFPDEAEWADGRLRRLYDQAREKATPAADKERPQVERRRVTLKDMDAAQTRITDLETVNKRLSGDARRAESEVERLRAENADLKQQMARMEGRIEELESLLDRRGLAVA